MTLGDEAPTEQAILGRARQEDETDDIIPVGTTQSGIQVARYRAWFRKEPRIEVWLPNSHRITFAPDAAAELAQLILEAKEQWDNQAS